MTAHPACCCQSACRCWQQARHPELRCDSLPAAGQHRQLSDQRCDQADALPGRLLLMATHLIPILMPGLMPRLIPGLIPVQQCVSGESDRAHNYFFSGFVLVIWPACLPTMTKTRRQAGCSGSRPRLPITGLRAASYQQRQTGHQPSWRRMPALFDH